jgi:hypothetical protein
LIYLRDLGETEVGGFGISRFTDLLLVEDIHLVKQSCSAVTVKFDDESVADYFDEQVDQGRTPEEFARIWVHTHPGDSPHPSTTDEETFDRCFGASDWAVMFIVASGGQTYGRLRFGTGPGGEFVLPVDVDFSLPFAGSDQTAWEAEYEQMVLPEPAPLSSPLSITLCENKSRAIDDDRSIVGDDPSFDPFSVDRLSDPQMEPFDARFW